ncbi:MAG: AraC family transcriptional regulator [Prevotella sp.]|nr:AraC family transcriptional regulator [Prevotella sp.]
MKQSLYLLLLMTAALMTGCADSGDPKDETGRSSDAGFYQAMGMADSLYNCMQFRDAYELYLQLLDSKEAIKYKKMYWDEKRAQAKTPAPTPAATPDDLKALTDEQLFQHIHEVVLHEHLFLAPDFDRQTIMDRFHLSKERVGAVFSKGSKYAKLNSYVLQLRLEYAAQLLVDKPEHSIAQIAADSGFGNSSYFSDRFRQHYGMSPSDYRAETKPQSGLTRSFS